jgi:hypothetical protein
MVNASYLDSTISSSNIRFEFSDKKKNEKEKSFNTIMGTPRQ